MNIANRVTGLQHIGLPTKDLKKSIEFYESLGFENIYETKIANTPESVAFMKLKNLVMEVYESKETAGKDGAIEHIALDVTDIEGVFEEIRAGGYHMLDGEIQFLPFWEHGVKYFRITGPNGEMIEFNQRL